MTLDKLLKYLRKDNIGVAHFKENWKIHDDPIDKSNILSSHLESIFPREDETQIPEPEG